jgi:hypothetical protein
MVYSHLRMLCPVEAMARYGRRVEAPEDPGANVDVGRLPEEAGQPFGDWIDVMSWVEADEEKLARREQDWLWIHRAG